MNSKKTTIAEHYRLQQWAAQIKDCQNRPEGMRITEWCIQNGITKGNYYYRLRRVREAYLNGLTKENGLQDIVPVDATCFQAVYIVCGYTDLRILIRNHRHLHM